MSSSASLTSVTLIKKALFDLLLTQKIEGRVLPYDMLQTVIENSILDINKKVLNAKISNFALNIDKKLVLGQIYVERKNAFIPVTGGKDEGASPTSYRVQVRFPFGLEMELNGQKIVLPSSEFDNPLVPYIDSTQEVHDDVCRSVKPEEIICGPGVALTKTDSTVTLTAGEDGISLPYTLEEGKGYTTIYNQKVYHSLEDYERRLKVCGVYPLFYSTVSDPRLLKFHDDYAGFTIATGRGETFEQADPHENHIRTVLYRSTLEDMESSLQKTPFGQRALAYKARMSSTSEPASRYLLNLAVINGRALFADSGLDVIRLRSYQVELFQACWELALKGQSHLIAGLVSMGVGAGKTYFTYALLQYLHHAIREEGLALPPSYSFAPTDAVAEVTARTVNRQGVKTGTSAAVVSASTMMPTDQTVGCYSRLSAIAARVSAGLSTYMNGELQAQVLSHCKAQGVHFNMAVNLLYGQGAKLSVFKETVDPRRLILLLEGLKTLIEKTGMLPIEGLRSFAEELQAIVKKIEAIKEKEATLISERLFDPNNVLGQCFFNEGVISIARERAKVRGLEDRYSELRSAAISGRTYSSHFSFRTGRLRYEDQSLALSFNTPRKLLSYLNEKFEYKGIEKTRFVRDTLVRLASLDNVEAAVLLANSGGLGNSYSEAEMHAQITRILPYAHRAFFDLAKALDPSLAPGASMGMGVAEGVVLPEDQDILIRQHYTLYLYLGQLFSTIPDEIKLKFESNHPLFVEKAVLTCRDMVTWLNGVVGEYLANIPLVGNVLDTADVEELGRYGISSTTNVVDAANQMAGIMALRVTGALEREEGSQALWLSHIPVFTPEGFADYVEYLDSLVGNPKVQIIEDSGVYKTELVPSSSVNFLAVQARLQEILRALVIADEVHKPEFSCFFDSGSPVYQRINRITQKYFSQEFSAVLPSRIGMSGTINEMAHRAFRGEVIYSLSIQEMMQQGLAKSVTVHRSILDAEVWYEGIDPESLRDIHRSWAREIVINYFAKASLSGLDIFSVSQGLIFSKIQNFELNQEIIQCFNQLFTRPPLSRIEAQEQAELLQEINDLRHRSRSSTLSVESLSSIQKEGFQDYCFALYLEFMLSKTSSPKELSDLIGLQNRLHQQGAMIASGAGAGAGVYPSRASYSFFSRAGLSADVMGIDVLKAIDGMNPTVIREADVTAWVCARISDPGIRDQLIRVFLDAKKDLDAALIQIQRISNEITLPFAITNVSGLMGRQPLESRTTMALIGSDAERTGYSHEPVGIVVDIESDAEVLSGVSMFGIFLQRGRSSHSISSHLKAIRDLIQHSFSYDEKTQMGGRALRTPAGEALFYEYQSDLNDHLDTLEKNRRDSGNTGAFSLRALRVETSFADIFREDALQAENARISISFNRSVFGLMESLESLVESAPERPVSFDTALEAVKGLFSSELANPKSSKVYCELIQERLPLLWAMAYSPELALSYFMGVSAGANESVFDESRREIQSNFDETGFPREHLELAVTSSPMPHGAGTGAGSATAPVSGAYPAPVGEVEMGEVEMKGEGEGEGSSPSAKGSVDLLLREVNQACQRYLSHTKGLAFLHAKGRGLVTNLVTAIETYTRVNSQASLDGLRLAVFAIHEGNAKQREKDIPRDLITRLLSSLPATPPILSST